MSTSLTYKELVTRLKILLGAGSSGLITGLSDQQHSFQIGFSNKRIVFLSYRILKGQKALEKLLLMKEAKITEHLNVDPPIPLEELDSAMVLTRMTMASDQQTGNGQTFNPSSPTGSLTGDNSAMSPIPQFAEQASASSQEAIDQQRIARIKNAANHVFGPIGSMVCDEHLTRANLVNVDLNTLLMRIAGEVGASNADAQAFIDRSMAD